MNPKVGQIRSIEYALNFFGIKVDNVEDLTKFIGPPLKETFKNYYGFNDDEIKIGIEKYREYFLDKGMFESEIYDGIERILRLLKSNSKYVFLATSNPTNFGEAVLKHFGVCDYFDAIYGSNLDGTMVNKNEIIAYGLNKSGVCDRKASCVMVGDRIHDVFGAKTNNVDSVFVSYGFGTQDELINWRPTFIVNSVGELEFLSD